MRGFDTAFARIARSSFAPPGGARLADSSHRAHVVQFYESNDFLFHAVAHFVEEGIARGERVLIVATANHREGILRGLDARLLDTARRNGEILVLDARATLEQLRAGASDCVDPDRFRAVLAGVLRQLWKDTPRGHTRAFGEMVDVLWQEGRRGAATQLEELWSLATRDHGLTLLCAYAMGQFGAESDAAEFARVCCSHDRVVPAESFAMLEGDDARTREVAVLQQRAAVLERETLRAHEIEKLLREALAERARVEAELRASVAREREARARAEASDAFKETFLALLGHELRNPLNTILTTARLMTMRRDLEAEPHRRMERIVQSGVRMQRLIEQLLDVTRARLAGGIVVQPEALPDVVPIVAGVIEGVRGTHRGRSIELVAPEACPGTVDPSRFEQVAQCLVENAVGHTAADVPVRVEVDGQAGAVLLRVHNGGPPIDPARLATLFDPFGRSAELGPRSAGLGLGLYITDCVVRAHGGTLAVTSTEAGGTRFDAWFPPVR